MAIFALMVQVALIIALAFALLYSEAALGRWGHRLSSAERTMVHRLLWAGRIAFILLIFGAVSTYRGWVIPA